jgi:hypothetical protein
LPKRAVTIKKFNLISTAIQGVIPHLFESVPAHKSCVTFACLGAAWLRYAQGVGCSVVAGAYALRHPTHQRILAFGEERGEDILATKNGFHMWVETKTHLIDFSSPLYPDVAAERWSDAPLPRNMMNMAKSEIAHSHDDLFLGRSLYRTQDLDLTKSLLRWQPDMYLLDLFLSWCVKLEKNPDAAMFAATDAGVRQIRRSGFEAQGEWSSRVQ